MYSRRRQDPRGSATPLYVDDNELSVILGLGKKSARRVAEQAGAVRKIGRRRVTHLGTVLEYIEKEYS